jgi:polysaccharide biosynthesis/export protein
MTSRRTQPHSPNSSESNTKLRIRTKTMRIQRRITKARLRLTLLQALRGQMFFVCRSDNEGRGFKQHSSTVLNPIMLVLLALVTTSSVHGQQPTGPITQIDAGEISSSDASMIDAYRIGSGDVLEVRVFNRPQLSRDAVRVDNRGLIRMPMIDSEIRAACRTEAELAAEITNLYLPLQRRPQVDVFIKEYSSRPVAVLGAVDKPGQFQLQRRVRLLELVSLAGGPTERAGLRVLVAHSEQTASCDDPTGQSANGFDSFDLNNILKGEASSNPFVRAGDIITLQEAQQIFVVGDVFRPTSVPLKETVTLSQAVAMAGGVMPDAKKDGVRILRQTVGSSARTEIVVDLNAISKRKADDPELLANDIVEVPTSTGKHILRGLMSAVAPAASSLPIRVVR